jgi:hypothetical protein
MYKVFNVRVFRYKQRTIKNVVRSESYMFNIRQKINEFYLKKLSILDSLSK